MPLLRDEPVADPHLVKEVFATSVRLEFPSWSRRNPWAKKLNPGEVGTEGDRDPRTVYVRTRRGSNEAVWEACLDALSGYILSVKGPALNAIASPTILLEVTFA